MRKIFTSIGIFCAIILLASCSKESEPATPTPGTFINFYASMRIINEDGTNFLTPEMVANPEIKIFKNSTGEFEEYQDTYTFYTDPEGNANFKIDLSQQNFSDDVTAIIKWNEVHSDTLNYGFIRLPNGSTFVNDLKVNGVKPNEFGPYSAFILRRNYSTGN